MKLKLSVSIFFSEFVVVDTVDYSYLYDSSNYWDSEWLIKYNKIYDWFIPALFKLSNILIYLKFISQLEFYLEVLNTPSISSICICSSPNFFSYFKKAFIHYLKTLNCKHIFYTYQLEKSKLLFEATKHIYLEVSISTTVSPANLAATDATTADTATTTGVATMEALLEDSSVSSSITMAVDIVIKFISFHNSFFYTNI